MTKNIFGRIAKDWPQKGHTLRINFGLPKD